VVRVAVAGVVGVVVGVLIGVVAGWRYAPAAGWSAAATVLVMWTWLVIAPMNAEQTEAHATREDPARALTDLVVLIASVASLAGVVYLLAAGSNEHGAGEAIAAGLGILSVAGAPGLRARPPYMLTSRSETALTSSGSGRHLFTCTIPGSTSSSPWKNASTSAFDRNRTTSPRASYCR